MDAGGKATWEGTAERREASLRERKAQMVLAARKWVRQALFQSWLLIRALDDFCSRNKRQEHNFDKLGDYVSVVSFPRDFGYGFVDQIFKDMSDEGQAEDIEFNY